MRLIDFDPQNEQKWALMGLIAASSVGIFSLAGRSDPLNDALCVALESFAASLPFLCLGLWAHTIQDQQRELGSGVAFFFAISILTGYVGSFTGLTALIWGLFKTAGILFLFASVIAFGIGIWLNIPAWRERVAASRR